MASRSRQKAPASPLSDSEFWTEREAEFERCATRFAEVTARWTAYDEEWQLYTNQGAVPPEYLRLFDAIALRAATRLPRALLSGPSEPWRVWLNYIRVQDAPGCQDLDSPISVSQREWERMQITGQSLSVVRTELENLEQEARQKVKNSGAALRNVRRAFGETVGGDGVEVFRRLQSKVIEHVFRVSAGFCFILASRPDAAEQTAAPARDAVEQPLDDESNVSLAEKGNLALLHAIDGELKRNVSLDVARRFGGVSLRAIQEAAKKHKLLTEGTRPNRRVLVESLLKYFPPEK